MKTLNGIWIAVVVLLAVGSRLMAAEFSPTLEAELAQAKSQEFVSAIVILESPMDIRALDDQLHVEKAGKEKRHADVLAALHYNADLTQPKFRAEFDQAIHDGVMQGYTAYWIENLFVIFATRDFIESFRPRGDVKYVTENFRPELIEPIRSTHVEQHNTLDNLTCPPGIRAVGALRVNQELGITGLGVIVGNMDTGVDGTHPALAARWRGNFAPWWQCWKDALHTTTTPTPNGDHGTHTMGTMTGRAISGSDTIWIGCAPDARWIANRCVDQGQSMAQFENDVIAGFQWFTDPDTVSHSAAAVPDVVQNSWGVTAGAVGVQCYDYWNTVILNCEAGGTVVTWSAGNEDVSGLRSPAIYSLNETQMFSIGAVDASAYPTTPYPLAYFSSQGPTPCTPAVPNNIKPEISAPGVNVYSSVPGGYDGTYSGTSMAGPHVAGIVALMRQACPDCDPTTIKMALINTAIRTGYVASPATENNLFGNGFIDGYAAVQAVSNLGRVGGIVRDASSNPLAGVTVKNVSGAQATTTNTGGQYYLPLPAGTYTIQYSKFGYTSQSLAGTPIVTGDTTVQNVTLQTAPQGTVSGTVTSCFGGAAVGATVTILNTSVTPATTNGSGFYSITLPQGTYDMQASLAGCGPLTVNSVVIGSSTTQNFTLPTDPRYLCSAADPYGYAACENVDATGPTYAWLAVAPSEGGSGTAVTGITDDSYVGPFTAPFSIKFYGSVYTSYYIGSNGFVTFGSGSSANTAACLPSSSVPIGVYAFWCDLNPGASGQVATYYDAANHWFVVEFYHVPHWNTTNLETFEIIFYDPNYYATQTGDANVVFQYNTVTDPSTNAVGIQATGSNANLYLCDGTLPASAAGLVAGRAIRFSTGPGCVGSPSISATPGSFSRGVPLNGTATDSTHICNSGPCVLNWSAVWQQTTPALLVTELQPMVVSFSKQDAVTSPIQETFADKTGVANDRRGESQLDSQGGPDSFGYRWIDSNQSGGPAYSWVEINTTGTNTGLHVDDGSVTLTLPWTFNFYGTNFSTVRVVTNGYMAFTGTSSDWDNLAIPSTSAPANMIAPFWDDMDLRSTGNIYYYNDVANTRFVVEWDAVPHYSSTGTGTYTFEVILYPDGHSVFQYKTLTGLITSATIGQQNAAGTVALQVVFNAAYAANNLAVRFYIVPPVPQWLSFSGLTSGQIQSGQCADLHLNFNATGLATGTYTGNVVLANNDPAHNPLTIPVTFTVGQLYAPTNVTILYLADTDQLQFNWTSSGAPQYKVMSGTFPGGPFATMVGSTTGTSLTVAAPASGTLFYVVEGWDGALASPPSLPAGPVVAK